MASIIEMKPYFRGKLHKVSFYFYLFLSMFLLPLARPGTPRISLCIYLITLVTLYGISSVLHVTDWHHPHLETRVQKLDHASIFLLIAGTYTPVCYCCLPGEGWVLGMLLSVWVIAIVGVVKCLWLKHISKVFNVGFYFLCGLTIIPFAPKIFPYVAVGDLIFFCAGGIAYLAGGFVYGLESPDPLPETFGYHEIFHSLTIVANLCFLVPILKGSLVKI